MNRFLKHNQIESEYFIDLIIYERAVDPTLKKRYEAKLKKWQNETGQIKSRIKPTFEVSELNQEKFYSSHLFGLLHVLASIPEHQSRKTLLAATGYPPEITNEAIDFLLGAGVLKISKDKIVHGEKHVHLGRDSKLIKQHHLNWRLATVQHMGFSRPDDLHYSLTFSCSESDAARIRESLLEHLKLLTQTIEKSKEERAFVYCFDFYGWY